MEIKYYETHLQNAEGVVKELVSTTFEGYGDYVNAVDALVEEGWKVVWKCSFMDCRICDEEVELARSWSNRCICGAEYNGAGQLLAPRYQWGYETGEEFGEDEDF